MAASPAGSLQLLLAKSEVHLWLQVLPPLAELLSRLDLLSQEERQRAERLQRMEARRRFLGGRLLLRTLLGRYSGLPPHAIPLGYTTAGKPYWPNSPLQFNLSHSHEWILVGLTLQRRIGVDLERIRPVPRWQRIARRYFSAAEQALLWICPPAERERVFLELWTQKEALLKAMGVGLAGARIGAGDPGWLTLPLSVAEGYVAAVAIERLEVGGPVPTVQLCQGADPFTPA